VALGETELVNRALLVIDVQESFRQRPLWQAVSNPDVLTRVDTLVAAARVDGDFVAWVLHAEPGGDGMFDPANGQVRLMDELTVADGEPVLVKTSYNAFTSTNLQQVLTKRGIRELRVCGIRSEQCVETTARVGCDLGFDVTYVVDATATFPIPHRDAPSDLSVAELLADPRTLPADDVVARTEYALAGRFATVATVAEVTGATLTTS
jgi:nicotinamidase-related amidase